MGQYDIARTYYERYADDENIYFSSRQQRVDYADILFRQGDVSHALEIIDTPDPESIDDAIEINRLKLKADIMSSLGRWNEAYNCLSHAACIEDSLSVGGNPYAMAVRDLRTWR